MGVREIRVFERKEEIIFFYSFTLNGQDHPKSFFEIIEYVKDLCYRITVLFTKSKNLVSNLRYKLSKLTLQNDKRIVSTSVTSMERIFSFFIA